MKQNKNTKIVLVVIVVLMLLYVGFIQYQKQFRSKYSWHTNYVYDNKQPYGTHILYQLLKNYSNNNTTLIEDQNLRDFLNENETITNANYFVIGKHCNYNEDDIVNLKQFVRRGNTAFIALEELSYDLLYSSLSSCTMQQYEYFYNPSGRLSVSFNDTLIQNYVFRYKYNDKPTDYYWKYFETEYCSTEEVKILSTINNRKPNFIKINYGKGKFLVHANPELFTNLYLIEPVYAAHSEEVFSNLNDGPIYWDRNSKLWSISGHNNTNGNEGNTPFDYILRQPALKWAYYLMWSLVILFVLFNLWRKQKAIPVKFPKKNTTLEFVHSIGELYFKNKDNKKLAIQKMNLFVKKARNRYNITENNEERFITLLAKKANIEQQKIEQIFNYYHIIENQKENISDEDLIKFYSLLKKL